MDTPTPAAQTRASFLRTSLTTLAATVAAPFTARAATVSPKDHLLSVRDGWVVSELRRHLKAGAIIKATDPQGRVLEWKGEDEICGGLTITYPSPIIERINEEVNLWYRCNARWVGDTDNRSVHSPHKLVLGRREREELVAACSPKPEADITKLATVDPQTYKGATLVYDLPVENADAESCLRVY